jgi:preprotein translocase subunit SecG
MNALFTLVVVVQVLAALVIIGLVLLQHGKGADMGAAFGSGASGSLFGASGSSNFLSKSTAVAAAIFFAATLALAFLGNSRHAASGGVLENLPVSPAEKPSSSGPTTNPAPAQKDAAPTAGGDTAGQANQIPK